MASTCFPTTASTPCSTGFEPSMMKSMMMNYPGMMMPSEPSCFNMMPSCYETNMPMPTWMMMNNNWSPMMTPSWMNNWTNMPWMNNTCWSPMMSMMMMNRGMMTPEFPMMMMNPWMNTTNNWMMPWWNNTEYRTNNSDMFNIGFRPSSEIEFQCLTHPVRVLDREGNRMVWLCFDMRGFKPEEICCTFNKAERCITVEATHDVKEGKEHHITRKFFRKFCFPESLAKCDLSKCELKSCLNSNGMLCVEYTLPKMTCEELANCPSSMMMNMMSPMNAADCYFANNYGRPSYRTNTNVACKIIA